MPSYTDIRRRAMAIGRVRKIKAYESIDFWPIYYWTVTYEEGGGTLEEITKMSAAKVKELFGHWLSIETE